MEIEIPKKLAKDFWPIFSKNTSILVFLCQIFITTIVGSVILLTGTTTVLSISFWVIISVLLMVNLTLNLLITRYIMEPTKDLIAAVLNISGERTILTPPNPSLEKYKNNGLRDAFMTLYNLSSHSDDEKEETADQKHNSAIIKSLNSTRCGLVIMNKKRQIIYSNSASPIRHDKNNEPQLQLFFNKDDVLNDWIDDCKHNAVKAEHTWTNIPDSEPGQENRRYFDVIASYRKGVENEFIFIFIDKTDTYSINESNLDFISFAAHELRGPITVIRGYVDVLKDELHEVLKDDQAELFRRLVVSSNQLSSYVDNILNTSRYDRRHLKVHLAEKSVESIFDVIRDDMLLRASSQNRLLTIDIPKDLPTIAIDLGSMSEVISNLIDNAIKYSNEGGSIYVTAKAIGDFVEISVKDTGIGMPESVVRNLFQKFYRSHRSRETVAGTGIGLYISKAIVESHGGTIGVRSQDGKGSTFTVSLSIYSTVADKLKEMDNSNEGLISEGKGWIKNHSMFRG